MNSKHLNENNKVIAKREDRPDGSKSASVEFRQYSAPLPPPEMMTEYEKIVPGSADRIIRRFEIQGDHRQECEKILVHSVSFKSKWGLVAGFVIAMTAILGGIYLEIHGKSGGYILSYVGLALLVGAFVTDKIILRDKETEGKK